MLALQWGDGQEEEHALSIDVQVFPVLEPESDGWGRVFWVLGRRAVP